MIDPTLQPAPGQGAGAVAPPRPWLTEVKATAALALPLVLAGLCQVAIWTSDVIMLGWLGPQPLAAATLAVHLQFAFIIFGLGAVSAVAPLVAQARGAHKPRGVRRSVRQGLWAGAFLTLVFTPIFWFSEPLILLLGQEPENAADAALYIRWMLPGLGPVLWIMVLRMFIAAFDRVRVVTYVTAAGIPVNVLVNYALIFGNFGMPALGLAGAGIASSLSNSFMFLCLLGYVVACRPFRRYGILRHLWRPDWPRFVEIFRLGIPIGIAMLFEEILFTVSAYMVGLLGTLVLAAHAIAMQCVAVSFMVVLGISQAATIRVGLHAGAGRPQAAYRAGWVALAMGTGFMSCVGLFYLIAPELVIWAFLDESTPGSAAVLALGVQFMFFAALMQVFDGAQVIASGALRGLKDVTVPMVVSLVSYWGVGLPTSVALGFWLGYGGSGVWAGILVGLGAAGLLHTVRFWYLRGVTR